MLAQVVGRAEAGEHQELRGDQRAGGEDDVGAGAGGVLRPVLVAPGDAGGAAVLDLDAADAGAEPDGQAGVVLQRLDVGVGGAASAGRCGS